MTCLKVNFAKALARRPTRASLLACSAWLVLGGQADAADAGDAGDGAGLSEVVVTAEKRETNLQKTPISISVVTAEAMADRHVQSLTDLNDGAVPGLRVMPFASRPFNMILNIRGVGIMSDTNQPARDPGVGVYVDGVYLGRPQGLDAALYDVERIEVLKGPQGTLFGRNTEAGALNITTKRPSGQFHLNMVGGLGNFHSYEGEFHLDLPEWNNFRVKVDGVVNARDGFVDNPLAGADDWGQVQRRGVRAQLQWRPTENFVANYAYDTGRTEETTLFNNQIALGTQKIATIAPLLPHRVKVGPIGVPLEPSVGRQWGHTLNLTWDVSDDLTLKSISSYRDLYQNQFSAPSGAGTPAPATAASLQFERYSLAAFDQYQYSQEFQAVGQFGRLQYVVGALAYHEHVEDQAQAYFTLQFDALGAGTSYFVIPYGANNIANLNGKPAVTNLVKPLFPYAGVDRASEVSTDSYGVYGQATYTPPIFEDRLHLTAGLRWTNDRKKGALLVVNNALPVNNRGVSGAIGFKDSWKRVDPMITLAFDVAPDVSVYGKWGTGYKSGGANSRSLSYGSFDPETISMFEVGAKSEFLDHRLRFNIAAYDGDYKDIQYDYTAPYYNLNPDGSISTVGTRTTEDTINAPDKGKVRGVEADAMLAPMEGLTISASYTYNYIRLPDALNPFPTFVPGVGMVFSTQKQTRHQQYTPQDSATLGVDYEMPVQDVTLRFHADANWNGGYYTTANDVAIAGGLFAPQLKTQAGTVVNARVSVTDIPLAETGGVLTVAFWVRNLFNEEHMVTRSLSITGGITGAFNDPRTFGLQASARF